MPGIALHIPEHGGGYDDPTEGSRIYAVRICLFTSLGGILFGYDQGVTGGILVMDSFRRDYCVTLDHTMDKCTVQRSSQLPADWINFATWYNMSYYVGSIVGALVGGFIADRVGRRMTMFIAAILFTIGTVFVSVSPIGDHVFMLIARVGEGLGVGCASFITPLFAAEMAPKELRGMLSGFFQMTIVIGLLFANVVNIFFQHHENGWRITNGIAVVVALVLMIGIFCVPESPRWVYLRKGRDAAARTLIRLRQTENVGRELRAIGEQLEDEHWYQVEWRDLMEPSVFRRVLIAMGLHLLQQATGINLVMTYGGMIFEDVIGKGKGVLAMLILSTVNFVSTIPAMRWVDTSGRRRLLLLGAVGMCLGHIVSALTFAARCTFDKDQTHCDGFARWLMIASTCFFVFNFAMSWGPVCWIYPSEIFPLNVRAKAVSLAAAANWTSGVVAMVSVQLFPILHISGVFFIFAGLCIVCGAFVYYKCPETKGLLLEDIEALFNKHAKTTSPVYISAEPPIREDYS